MPLSRRVDPGALRVRAGAGDGTERIIEGIVVPFDTPTVVDDGQGPYRESIARGAVRDLEPSSVLLEYVPNPNTGQGHAGAILIGRGETAETTDAGLFMGFRVSRTSAGNDGLELARDGILRHLSVVMDPIAERRRSDGVLERTAIALRRVALLERGAYGEGATVTAVRAAAEGRTVNCPDCGRELIPGVAHSCPSRRTSTSQASRAAATPPAPEPESDDGEDELEDDEPQPPQLRRRQGRTRTSVSVNVESQRAAAERETAGQLARAGGAAIGRGGIRITRAEPIYGPGTGQSFFRDQFHRSEHRADGEALDRLARHDAMLRDVDDQLTRSAGIESYARMAARLERAGDVLSSEIPGAYPNEYLPGLLVPRILKQRPFGSFYTRVPVTDGRPKIYPVVSTSTSVAAQGAEGSNPAASDFATTATTVTPLIYGGETSVSRQVLDGADPSIDAMLNQDLTEAYSQASEAIIRAAVEAGSTASGVTLTAATPNIGLINLVLNYFQNIFVPADGLFLPTTLYASWLTQLDTTNRPLAPFYGPMNAAGISMAGFAGGVLNGVPVAQSWSSTAGAGAGVGGVAVAGRETDFAIFESNLTNFTYDQGAGAPAAVRIGVWAYLVVGTRRGSRKATGA